MAHISNLPIEVFDQILFLLDPVDVAHLAKTCSIFYAHIYNQGDQYLWRELYLLQPFDDLRHVHTSLGHPVTSIDWKHELQRIIRARTILTNVPACRPEERCTILRTLTDMITTVVPAKSFEDMDPSPSHAWVTVMLRGSTLLEHEEWALSDEERQLRARLHTYYGLTARDFQPAARKASRVFLYAMRHYKYDNDFGPFMMDGSGRVNWVHMRAIHHVMSLHIVPPLEIPAGADPASFTLFPMSLPWTISVIPEGVNLDEERDWAGVTGRWQCSFCFCDHRELLSECYPADVGKYLSLIAVTVYNDYNVRP